MIALHEAKSKYSYMYDENTLHLRVSIERSKAKRVQLIYGDPFMWNAYEEGSWNWAYNDEYLLKKEYETKDFDHFFIALSPDIKRVKYAFIVDEEYFITSKGVLNLKDEPDQIRNLFNYYNFPYLNKEDMFEGPAHIKDQVFYSIFPERFCNSGSTKNKSNIRPWNDTLEVRNEYRYGGDLKGIISKLDYLSELGITGLYLTPIFKSYSAHKYDINDYYEIDSAFGNKSDLKLLVEEAHKRNILVVLDAVFNHCGFDFFMFQDVLKYGKDSKYYDCFYVIDQSKKILDYPLTKENRLSKENRKLIHGNSELLNYRSFAFTPDMPKLNTMHPLVKEYLLDVAAYYIREFNIDGWRLDVSNEVPHAFWKEFRMVVKNLNKDCYIVGENWDDSYPWLKGDEYDGVMNYEMLYPMWNFFGTNIDFDRMSKQSFIYAINKVLVQYPKNVLNMLYNLVDSHDTTRIKELCSNDNNLMKLPYIFMFSLPGAPSIYYGDEVGISGTHDPGNRRCMPWDEIDYDHLDFFKKLIEIRKEQVDLKSSAFTWIDSSKDVLVYKKNSILIILNRSYETSVDIVDNKIVNKIYLDLFSNKEVFLTKDFVINKYGFMILKEK